MTHTLAASHQLEVPRVAKIVETRDEDSQRPAQIRTFLVGMDMAVRPGQFVQVWLPRVNEKPFSVSYLEPGLVGFTAAKVGPFTEALFERNAGDLIGLRGPYGNGFDLRDAQRVVIVSGGCGCAPTALLAEQAHREGREVTYIIGARTSDLLLFVDRMSRQGIRVRVATDDGSAGTRGFATDLLMDETERGPIDLVAGCGPEIMLKRVHDICRRRSIACQLSLERYMKCAIGVCGACALDGTGWLVCKDGPVFTGEQLEQVVEFGRYHRDAAGRVITG